MRRSGVRPPSAPPGNPQTLWGYTRAGAQARTPGTSVCHNAGTARTDMATIRRRGTTWQVQVRRQGHSTLSRTFRLRADAEQWARQKEAEIDRGEFPVDTRVLRSHTLATCWNVMPPASSPGSVEGAASVTCSASLLFPLDFQKRSTPPRLQKSSLKGALFV